ncbi:MAG: hypothetical protein ABGX41_02225, partial [Pseudohongiella sp.]
AALGIVGCGGKAEIPKPPVPIESNVATDPVLSETPKLETNLKVTGLAFSFQTIILNRIKNGITLGAMPLLNLAPEPWLKIASQRVSYY